MALDLIYIHQINIRAVFLFACLFVAFWCVVFLLFCACIAVRGMACWAEKVCTVTMAVGFTKATLTWTCKMYAVDSILYGV